MDGKLKTDVGRWCSEDVPKSLARCFNKIALAMDEKIRETQEENKRKEIALDEEKIILMKDYKQKEKDLEARKGKLQKEVEELRRKEVTIENEKKMRNEFEQVVKLKEEKLETKKKEIQKAQEEIRRKELALENDRKLFEKEMRQKESEMEAQAAEVRKELKHREKEVKHREKELEQREIENKAKAVEVRKAMEMAKEVQKAKDQLKEEEAKLVALKAELDDKEHYVEYRELEVEMKQDELKKKGTERRSGEWIALDEYARDQSLVGDNHVEVDRLRKVTKMMERNQAVVYIRTDCPIEITVGVKSVSARDVERVHSVKGQSEKQCLKDLGDDLLKRVRNSYVTSGAGRTPSVSSFRA